MNIQYRWEELIPLKENKDSYQPSQQQIVQYGEYLGLNFPEDLKYSPLLEEALKASLPPEWQACSPKDSEDILYRNKITKIIQIEHPFDEICRDKVLKLKKLHSKLEMAQIEEERESMLIQSSLLMKTSKEEKNPSLMAESHDLFLDNITEESMMQNDSQMKSKSKSPLLSNQSRIPVLSLSQLKSSKVKIKKSHRTFSKRQKKSPQTNESMIQRLKQNLFNYFPKKYQILNLQNLHQKGETSEEQKMRQELREREKAIMLKKEKIEELRQKKRLKLQLLSSLKSAVQKKIN